MKKLKPITKFLVDSFKDKEGKVSSKRLALFSVIVYLGYVVFTHSSEGNATEFALILTGSIATLTGAAVYNNIKIGNDDINKNVPKETDDR